MMEGNQDFVFMDSIKVLQRNMGILFNNAKYSDTTFIVKEKKFHALSQLVSVSSSTLDSLISSHVAHCTDKEIKISDVKNAESFTIILRYVYGLEINFSQLDKTILCEVLNLSETYKLPEFTKGLKEYLAKVEIFTIDTLAVLLNTAKKFNLDELYEKLSIFAYLNAEEFVKHESIKDVQYDVLLDLLKSNWLYTEEINILRGVLNWHSDMYCKKEASKIEETLTRENDVQYPIEEQDVRSNIQTDVSDCEKDLAESIDTLSLDEDDSKEVLCTEVEELIDNPELISNNSNENHGDTKDVIPNEAERQAEVIESFSESVLKSLLSHIRYKQFSWFDIMTASKTELFKKYERFLADDEHFSQSNEPRQKYVNVEIETLSDIQKVFTLPFTLNSKVLYDSRSEEHHSIGDLEWSICFKHLKCDINPALHNYHLEMYIECLSDKLCDWECKVECQLILISHDNKHPNLVLPGNDFYMSVEFTSEKSKVCVGKYYRDFDWYESYVVVKDPKNKIVKSELKFKSIQIVRKLD